MPYIEHSKIPDLLWRVPQPTFSDILAMRLVSWRAHEDDDFVLYVRFQVVELVLDPREVTLDCV